MLNFYGVQMDTLRNQIVQQNGTILNQNSQIGVYEQKVGQQKNKIADLEDRLKGNKFSQERVISSRK
mgnify:FL=1